jgi:hypothetical protein
LVEEQFGFRGNSSTIKATQKLLDEIRNALNNKLSVDGIFCDLEKAFDCVNPNILLSKLESYGGTAGFHKLIKSYLADRYSEVQIDPVFFIELLFLTGERFLMVSHRDPFLDLSSFCYISMIYIGS